MLSAVSFYRYTKDPILLDSIQTAVKGLLEAQSPNGYIGNYAEKAQLQEWDIWGRKYSMLGLLAYYDLTGERQVLDACRRMANHLIGQVAAKKINIVNTGNYRGMASSSILEPMLFLYERTRDNAYLDFAKEIVAQWETADGPQLLTKAEAGIPVAERFPHPQSMGESWFSPHNGQKAYEMMSCYEGLLELYKLTSNPRYLSAVEKTVRSIIESEINIAGSGSAFECWYQGKALQTQPTYHTMETCVTMTWMKLCQTLLCVTGNPLYADQIEVTAYNALLASLKADASEIAKYSPLEGHRHPGEEQCRMPINCCNANGPRAFALLPGFAVMQSNKEEVYINLYSNLEKELRLASKKTIRLKQETNYPVDGTTCLQLQMIKPETFTLALRIPLWSRTNSVEVNGERLEGIVSGSYYKITRTWKTGDVIRLEMDVRGRIFRQNGHVALMKGPVVLARDSRFQDGFVDETAQITETESYVDLLPVAGKPQDIWMAFTAPLILGTDLEGEGKHPKQIRFCDFSSAGNTWEEKIRYRVWIPGTINVMKAEYRSYQ
jgi:DUF1680 family protein